MSAAYNVGMPVTLTTADVPAVYMPSGFVDLDAAENNTGASGAAVLRTFYQGQVDDVPEFLNRNVASQELGVRYGGGANAVGYGLDLSAGVGLVVNVAQGHAIASGGVVQVSSGQSVAGVPNNSRVYIWLKDNGDGTFGFAYGTTTARPTGGVVFLGSVLTASGSVSSVDQSGVVYLRGGVPFRETADVGAPTDAPPSMVLLHRTLDGLYLWDGTEWSRVPGELAHQATSVAAGKTELVPAGRQAVIHGAFDVDGTLDVYGDFLVLE